jgi:outer membrane protein TolC
VGITYTTALSLLPAQQLSIEPVRPSAPAIVRPYMAPTVPPARLANSPRLSQLIRAGTLYLTAQDAIALALENNIDIEVARYNPIIAEWNVTRSEAGGALPGVPSNASQAGAVALGQGVAGSQAAAGVRISGFGNNAGQTANATVAQVGPVTQTLDPSIQEQSTFSHTSTPQANSVQSLTGNLIANTRAHSFSYQQGFLTGGNITVRYTDNYLNENSPTDVLNPSSAPTVSITAAHNLLRGFGIAVNARTITVAKMNLNTSDLSFKTQVINLVVQVLNVYYGLASAYDDVKAKTNAADVARTFVDNVKEQVRLGAVAPPDLITAQSQAVTSQQAVVDSRTNLQQEELTLKSLISRTGSADPLLREVRIVPTDKIVIPEKDELPPLDQMVSQALANRSDLAAERANLAASEVSALGTKNGLRPNLQVFGGESHAGLAGEPRVVTTPRGTETADPYFVGGIGTALGQLARRNFPTDRIGAFFQAPIHNRQAQADYAIDQLQLRQSQLSAQKDSNQVQVDVLNYVVALQQARARYDAAVKNRVLQQDLFASEQKKYALGASTPYNVTQQQRDLVTAQSAEMSALVSYSTARIALDRTLGTTLEANHVSIAQARLGIIK